MKKTLLAIFAAFSVSTAYAQTSPIQVPSTSVTFYGSYLQTLIAASFPVVNISSQPIDIKVRRKVITNVAGSDNNFCWGVNCYPPNVSVSPIPTVIPANGTDNSFVADYNPNGMPGLATIRYTFFKVTGSPDSVQVEVNFDARSAVMGTRKHLNSSAISIGTPKPNPANDLTTIDFNLPANSRNNKLRIFNAIGGLVKEVALTQKQGTAILTTTNLANGVYFYTLQVDGYSVETKKLIVRH
jgi:hypothetical protein